MFKSNDIFKLMFVLKICHIPLSHQVFNFFLYIEKPKVFNFLINVFFYSYFLCKRQNEEEEKDKNKRHCTNLSQQRPSTYQQAKTDSYPSNISLG